MNELEKMAFEAGFEDELEELCKEAGVGAFARKHWKPGLAVLGGLGAGVAGGYAIRGAKAEETLKSGVQKAYTAGAQRGYSVGVSRGYSTGAKAGYQYAINKIKGN
jgi:hypothetical protein